MGMLLHRALVEAEKRKSAVKAETPAPVEMPKQEEAEKPKKATKK